MFSKINILSKTLVVSGLFIFGLDRLMRLEWLEVISFSLIAIGLMLGKNDLFKSNQEYGKLIYYTLITLMLLIIYFYWFV